MSGDAMPVFVPQSAISVPPSVDGDDLHVMFCKLYTYDCFQNEKCLFKGLAKVWVPRAERGQDANGDGFFVPKSQPPPKEAESEAERSCIRRIESYYGTQLKKRFSGLHNFAEESEVNVPPIQDYVDVPSIRPQEDTAREVGSERFPREEVAEQSEDWSLSQTVAEDDQQEYVDYNTQFQQADKYMGMIDPVELEYQPLENFDSDGRNKIANSKLDYEMLLPPSVVESTSYLTLQPPNGSQEQCPEYDNLYEGLFEGCENVHDDHISIVEDIESKETINDYLSPGNRYDDHSDDSYLFPDVSGITAKRRRTDSVSSRYSDVKCDVCGRKCRTLNALTHHMLVHSEERPFVCEICKKAFKEQPTLRRHMWTHMEKQHQCDICEKYFVEKSSLRRHITTIHADFKPGSRTIQSNTKQQFGCMKCGKLFKSQAKFQMHQEMHGNPNYECEVCGKVYAGRSHLRIHQRIHTGEKPYCCNICTMQFAFKHVLKSHQARIHQKIHKFKCNLCSLTFVKKSELSSHASCHMANLKKGKRHYGSRKVSKKGAELDRKRTLGSKCLIKYNYNQSPNQANGLFGQLIDMMPEGQDKFETIDITDGSSSSRDGVAGRSPRSTTADKKNKECLECFKAFERMGDLKRHIISHIVENIVTRAREQNNPVPVYECEICPSTVFKQVDKFKKHLREHAKLTLYQCDVCDRAFGDSSNFSKHKKVHGVSYLKCLICNRKFNTKRMMVRHMEYHRHNKPKACPHCRKLFHFESNLRKHIKIAHLTKGKMTYRCEECGERFNSVKQKWEHQWEEHGIRKVDADCYLCEAQFRKVSLLRAHLIKEHASVLPSTNR